MSEPAVVAAAEPEKKGGLRLPSAYTILFALIVLAAIATWVIPAGVYNLNGLGEPIPGTYHEVASHPAHILRDSLTAPINGRSADVRSVPPSTGSRLRSSGRK